MEFLPEAHRPDAGFESKVMAFMGIEIDATPYGTTKKCISGPTGPSSFKPVIHGQFRLRRVDMIDKFGQVVHLLDPTPVPDDALPEKVPKTWPCLSDWYSPGSKFAKNVGPLPSIVEDVVDKKDLRYEFVQVPPQIN
ncbi:hypothetical protein ACHAPA_006634 [Fusarium lateritium]